MLAFMQSIGHLSDQAGLDVPEPPLGASGVRRPGGTPKFYLF